jgi:hypothetical protein
MQGPALDNQFTHLLTMFLQYEQPVMAAASPYTSLSPESLGPSTCDSSLNIITEVLELQDVTVQRRRWFHQHPELAFHEVETAKKVAECLKGTLSSLIKALPMIVFSVAFTSF